MYGKVKKNEKIIFNLEIIIKSMADIALLEQFKNDTLSINQVAMLLREFYLAERKTLTYKISVKGAISFYGMRRMPFTVYKDELDQIAQTARTESFKQFIITNRAQLSVKDQSKLQEIEETQETPQIQQTDSVTALLESFKNGQITMDVVQEHLRELEHKTVTYKVSNKGAISFYGIRRMPITLYREELDQIMGIVNSDEFTQYIQTHASELSSKAIKQEVPTQKPVRNSTKGTKKPTIKLNMVN
jgi:hypothetical protein